MENITKHRPPRRTKSQTSQRSRPLVLHTRWAPYGRAPIGLINRISCLDGILFWMVTFVFRLMVMTAPALYWWTGTSVIRAEVRDLVYWLLPALLASMLFMGIWGRSLILPIINDITHLLATRAVVTNVLCGLFRPWGRPFKVTPKGVSRDGVTVQWGVMLPYLGLAVIMAAGMLVNASPYSPLMAGCTATVRMSGERQVRDLPHSRCRSLIKPALHAAASMRLRNRS